MAKITSINEPWGNGLHNHKDVEDFIKSEIERLSGESSRTNTTITITDGITSRTFIDKSNIITFKYIVNYTIGDVIQTSIKYKILWKESNTDNNWKEIEHGVITTNIEHESPNLSNLFNNITANNIEVRLFVYDTREVNNEFNEPVEEIFASQTQNITYIRKIASVTSQIDLGTIINDNTLLRYFTVLNGDEQADLIVNYYSVSGSIISDLTVSQKVLPGNRIIEFAPPIFNTNEKGAHKVEAYLKLKDGTESDKVTDTIISVNGCNDGDIYISSEDVSNASINNYVNIDFRVYVYRTTLIQDEYIPVLLQEQNNSNRWETKSIRKVPVNAISTWKYLVKKYSNSLRLAVPTINNGVINENTILASKSVYFNASESKIGWIVASDSMIYLTAQNKTNSDYDVGTWKDGARKVIFENVQWKNGGSGWVDTYLDNTGKIADPSNSLIQGRYSTSLHLVGNSKAYIKDFYPLYSDATFLQNQHGGGILENGRTLKMSFMITNVSNPDEKIIECYDYNSNTGFYVTGNAIYINISGKELVSKPDADQNIGTTNTRRFSENTRIDLTIVVQPYYINGVETKHEIRYYVNGEIAGFDVFDSESLSQSEEKLLVFGGNGGAILDLFDFRYYEKALTAFEVLQTRTMDLDSSNEMNATFEKNNFYHIENNNPVITLEKALEYGKYLAEQGKTNFAVWASTNLCNSPSNMNNTKSKSTRKESFYLFRFKTDNDGQGIIDPDMTFFVEALKYDSEHTESSLRMRRQGTSTASSTKGNIRVDVVDTCRYHKFNAEEQKFYPYIEGNDSNENVYEIDKRNGRNIWKIPDANAIPCYLLTCKKNPNESTQARNLPTAKWYEDCCRYLATIEINSNYPYEDCLTKPQRDELASIKLHHPDWNRKTQVSAIKTRQCIDGIPSLGFQIAYCDNDNEKIDPLSLESSFGGQFDMITDKTNMDVFGFGGHHEQDANGNLSWVSNGNNDNDYSIEWRRNNSTICNFLTQDLKALNGSGTFNSIKNNFENDLEYRYPDVEPLISWSGAQNSGLESDSITRGMEQDGAMQRLFDFVRTCAVYSYNNNGQIIWNIDGNAGEYYNNGELCTNNNFPGKIPLCDAYGNAYEWVDDNVTNRINKFRNELKYYVVVNQFLFNAIAIDVALMVDQDVKNQFFTYFTGEDDEYGNKLLRLLGYDFDSSWDMDNSNRFRFLYTVRYEDGLYDGASIIPSNSDGLNYSTGALKNTTRGPVLWQLIYKAFPNEIAEMSEELYAGFLNKNSILKRMEEDQVNIYNSLIYNSNSEYSYTTNAGDYPKTHGAAKEHTEWFVEGRMYYYEAMQCVKGENVKPQGDFAKGVAEFELKTFTESQKNTYPLNYENHGSENWALNVTGYERTAAGLGYGQGGFYGIVPVEVDINYNETPPLTIRRIATLTANGLSRDELRADARLKIFGGKHLKTITGLSKLYILSITNWGDLTNVEELEIGRIEPLEKTVIDNNDIPYTITEEYVNPLLTRFDVTEPFGSCKRLNLAGCIELSGKLDLKKFPVLEEFEGRNMGKVTSIDFPISNSLQSAHLSTGLQELIIENKQNLTDLTIQNTSKITTVKIVNSSIEVAQFVINTFLIGE